MDLNTRGENSKMDNPGIVWEQPNLLLWASLNYINWILWQKEGSKYFIPLLDRAPIEIKKEILTRLIVPVLSVVLLFLNNV